MNQKYFSSDTLHQHIENLSNFSNHYNYSPILILIGIILILMSFTGIYFIYKTYNEKLNNKEIDNKNSKNSKNNINNLDIKIDIGTSKSIKNFIIDLVDDRFNYYLYTEILPLYMSNKKLDKTMIQEIKEKIFIEISLFLSKEQKKYISNYFTQKGIQIFIYERVVILINKIDLSFYKNIDQINEKDVDALLKDVK